MLTPPQRQTFRFVITDEEAARTLPAGKAIIPGVKITGSHEIVAPANAKAAVQQLLDANGVPYEIITVGASARLPSLDECISPEIKPWVRDYLTEFQAEGVPFLVARPGGFAFWPCGSGKTLLAIIWMLAVPGPCVFVTRSASRGEPKPEGKRTRRPWPVATIPKQIVQYTNLEPVVLAGEKAHKLDPNTRIHVISWEILPAWVKELKRLGPVSVVFDECFPAGTQVETEHGAIPIESVEPGVQVKTTGADGVVELKRVIRRFDRRRIEPMVRVVHEAGSFVCTPNHKIWTEEAGYVSAIDLDAAHHLCCLRNRGVSAEAGARESSAEVLQPDVCRANDRQIVGETCEDTGVSGVPHTIPVEERRRRADEPLTRGCVAGVGECQSDKPKGSSGTLTLSAGANISGARREWADDGTPTTLGADLRAADGGCDRRAADNPGTVSFTAEEIHGGSSGAVREIGGGSGWELTQDAEVEVSGPAQGSDLVRSRVVRVEILERRSDGGSGVLREAYPVYDLEVEDNHNYFADGVLVSNSHSAKSNKRWEAIPRADGGIKFKRLDNVSSAANELSIAAQRRLATSATPVKDRVRDLWAQLDLIEPYAFGSFRDFSVRYCDGKQGLYGWDSTGRSNEDELLGRLKGIVHNVPYSRTHGKLPPKRREVVYLDPKDQNKETPGFLKELKHAVKMGPNAVLEVKIALAASRKKTYVVNMVKEFLAEPKKVIVFTGRRKDVELLRDAIGKIPLSSSRGNESAASSDGKIPVFWGYGGMPLDQIAAAYAEHPGPCVLVGTGDAFGESIDGLQDTDHLIQAQLPYTPGQIIQREGRVSRHGQKRDVTIHYIIAEGTVDEHVADILIGKLPVVEKVVGDEQVGGLGRELEGIEGHETELIQSILDSFEEDPEE